jgi:chromatin modification-related protein VID21
MPQCYANGQEWMRLDFAEERRWKRVLAREFAYQVVEWHLSSPRDKASLMVGGTGWGARRRASASKPKSKTNGKAASEIKDKESVEDNVAMDEEAEEENTGGQVLDEIMPRRATRGRKPKRRADAEEDLTPEPESNPTTTKDADVEMDEDEAEPAAKIADDASIPAAAVVEDADKGISAKPNAEPDADAEGEADADGEADAEGEVDAQGEDDGESADVVDGVIGLGGKFTTARRIRTDFRYTRRRWRRC